MSGAFRKFSLCEKSNWRSNLFKVGLYTLGCKVSSYETEAVAEAFEREGFTVSDFDGVCDVYVINTCTVTAESDAKSRKYIRRAIRNNPSAVVIAIGCYTQRAPSEVAAISGVSAVIGTADKLSAVEIAKKLLSERGDEGRGRCEIIRVGLLTDATFEEMKICRAPRTRGYVKIEDGCDCKCTYCAISQARGPVRSKKPKDVLREVKTLAAGGTKEIVLTGIETGSYGKDLGEGCDLGSLLALLDRERACERIRLGSMAPELLGERFVSRACVLPILVPHFHVSMQSGSDRVLGAMKRRYNRRMALANIARIREYMPECTFTADLMVGFPGETEENFLDTVRFVKEARLLDAHVFAYSKREGTEAAVMEEQVADDVKKERSARLISAKNRMRDEVLSDISKRRLPLECIMETADKGGYVGHSDSYIEVFCESEKDIRGECVSVLPITHKNGIIYGEIIT